LSGDFKAVMVGVFLGLAIVGLVLWRHGAEVKRSWQMRFGSAPKTPAAMPEPSDDRGGMFPLSPWKRRIAAGMSLLASLGNAALAVTAAGDGESLHQLLRVLSAVVFATIAGLVVLKGRPQGE
jgi:hypothetical protein